MGQVWLCEPLALLLPHNIWFKARFLITVLNSGNYSLRLRTLLSFFMDSLRCSNLWWLSGMSFLPLILSPHSFPICLSLPSCPQTSTGRLKEFGGFLFFFFNAKPMSRFYTNYEALFAVKMRRQRAFVPVDVHVRGYSGSELKLGRSRAFRSHRPCVFIYA